jgi:hypothetical protein
LTTTITESPIDAGREREIAKARAEVLRLAEVEGINPFTNLEDFTGDAEITADFDVDQFLGQVREDRDRTSTHGGK